RILLLRTVSHDMRRISPKSDRLMLLAPQRLDRIERGGAHGRPEAEEKAYARRQPDAQDDRPGFDEGGQRRELADDPRREEAERRADEPAKCRERDRLGEDLPEDVAPAGAERLAKTDLARPLAHD